MKVSTFVLWVSTLVAFILILLNIISKPAPAVDLDPRFIQLQKSLDSLTQKESQLYTKIDSIQKIKTKLVTHYETTSLKYDTLRVTIDSMGDTQALLFLLSKSRQLTAKGID